MNQKMNATELPAPFGIRPLAMAGIGHLRAMLWESEDGCQFLICREDPETGEISTEFGPHDVEHLTLLAAVIANAIHLTKCVEQEFADDLSCMGHCVSQTLGYDIDANGVPHKKRRQ